jgi:hypothetical protein
VTAPIDPAATPRVAAPRTTSAGADAVAGAVATPSRWEGAAFMATGLALVIHILVDMPLWTSALTTVGVAAAALVVSARRHPDDRAGGRDVLRVGALSACAALVAYDGTRLAVTTLFDFEVTPFAALPHFGSGLIGASASHDARWAAGAAIHVTNAITFGIAYTIWAGRRGVVAGIAFGLALEAVMLGLYPAWLQIPNMREFASMSVIGHVAYGATLGFLARRGLDRLAERNRGSDRGVAGEREGSTA